MKWLAIITIFALSAMLARKEVQLRSREAERVKLTQEIDRQYRLRSIAELKLTALERGASKP